MGRSTGGASGPFKATSEASGQGARGCAIRAKCIAGKDIPSYDGEIVSWAVSRGYYYTLDVKQKFQGKASGGGRLGANVLAAFCLGRAFLFSGGLFLRRGPVPVSGWPGKMQCLCPPGATSAYFFASPSLARSQDASPPSPWLLATLRPSLWFLAPLLPCDSRQLLVVLRACAWVLACLRCFDLLPITPAAHLARFLSLPVLPLRVPSLPVLPRLMVVRPRDSLYALYHPHIALEYIARV